MESCSYKPGTIVSLKGLRPRARGVYHIGQKVMAYSRKGEEGVEEVVIYKGSPYGCDSIVPYEMVQFDKAS